jgi:hypothetical protein
MSAAYAWREMNVGVAPTEELSPAVRASIVDVCIAAHGPRR